MRSQRYLAIPLIFILQTILINCTPPVHARPQVGTTNHGFKDLAYETRRRFWKADSDDHYHEQLNDDSEYVLRGSAPQDLPTFNKNRVEPNKCYKYSQKKDMENCTPVLANLFCYWFVGRTCDLNDGYGYSFTIGGPNDGGCQEGAGTPGSVLCLKRQEKSRKN